ncbi:MarR family winged helix-turn-helix transcriptional regulator [Kineosporia sp. A_224]|uniref:MarR family winged helix-turn-helix transcriptional regulator n=1 Tax=Kineosporia sp. A_224 TaxID=1962180 RepID=UPI001E3947EB|nr:MarR family transcriptional regulator [Kineosporia sp. A_224]
MAGRTARRGARAVAGEQGPVLGDLLCFSLYTASRAVTRAYGPVLAELGLTYPQWVTMVALWESAEPLSVGELGRRLHLDSGTLTPLLKRLEADGLVTRTRDLADERRVLVAVTPAGAALRKDACDVPARIAAAFGGDAGAILALKRQLDQLVEVVESSSPG